MFFEIPQNLLLIVSGTFLLGWILSYISSRIGAKYRAKQRDPRDDRIRSLDAELRIAQTDRDKYVENLKRMDEQLKETKLGIERRDNVITQQQEKLQHAAQDLKDSVMKTRQLRGELTERATETVQAEARIREVQTELSVAQASQDMLATGVLDYDMAPDDDSPEGGEPRKMREARGANS